MTISTRRYYILLAAIFAILCDGIYNSIIDIKANRIAFDSFVSQVSNKTTNLTNSNIAEMFAQQLPVFAVANKMVLSKTQISIFCGNAKPIIKNLTPEIRVITSEDGNLYRFEVAFTNPEQQKMTGFLPTGIVRIFCETPVIRKGKYEVKA